MVVQRGFKQPTSYHDERLRREPVGYFFDVITNGFAKMPVVTPNRFRFRIAGRLWPMSGRYN